MTTTTDTRPDTETPAEETPASPARKRAPRKTGTPPRTGTTKAPRKPRAKATSPAEVIEGAIVDDQPNPDPAPPAQVAKPETAPLAEVDLDTLTLPEITELLAYAKAVADEAAANKANVQGVADEKLLALYEESGTDGVKLFVTVDGRRTPVGNLDLRFDNTDKCAIARPDEFALWAMGEHPTEVDMKPVVRPAWQTAYLKTLVAGPDAGQAVDPKTGEVVPGVRFTAATGQPKGSVATFTRKQNLDGRAITHRVLMGATIGSVIPAIGGVQ